MDLENRLSLMMNYLGIAKAEMVMSKKQACLFGTPSFVTDLLIYENKEVYIYTSATKVQVQQKEQAYSCLCDNLMRKCRDKAKAQVLKSLQETHI